MKTNLKKLYVLIFAVMLFFSWGCSNTDSVAKLPIEKASDQETQKPSGESPNTELDLANTTLNFLQTFEKEHPQRSAGTDAEVLAANDLFAVLESMGYAPTLLPFEYETTWAKGQKSQNIEIKLQSSVNPPENSKSYILLGAHYDSVPKGHGADDNGSGVSLLITIADYLKKHPIETDVVFVFFGAEEVGLKGSEAYANYLKDTHTQYPSLMINYDSLIAGDYTYVYGSASNPDLLEKILGLANDASLNLITQDIPASGLPYGETIDASDHAAFKALGIPYLYFEATNWNLGAHDGYTQTDHPNVNGGEIWHTKNDNLPFIEETFPGRPYHHLDVFIKSTILFLKSYE